MFSFPHCAALHVFLMIHVLLLSINSEAWGWFGSASSGRGPAGAEGTMGSAGGGVMAKFSMEGVSSSKGAKLVENAKGKLVSPNTCWQNAYGNLFAGCSEVLASEERRSRFAWHLSDCFQKDSGRSPFPRCDGSSSLVECRKKLDEAESMVFLQFYIETNSICHQLQADAFKRDTERLVNDLRSSAAEAEDRLETIQDRSESILRTSEDLQGSLVSIDHRTQQLSQQSQAAEEHIREVLNHTEAVFEQSRDIAASQTLLQEGQSRMKEQLRDGMEKIKDSYSRLFEDIEGLRAEAAGIEREIASVREGMFSKMEALQGKADEIGIVAETSLEKNRELLEGQSTAVEGIRSLAGFMSESLEESRSTMQGLAEYSSRLQSELLKRQDQLYRANDHLVESSKSILAAQEAFESKQATMFVALEKLFALHNAMLLESRWIKSFFMYALSIFIIYMFTSTKQTYNVRPWLYIGLCVTFVIELLVLRIPALEIEQQAKITTFFRSLFTLLAAAQLLHAIFTYRDYEVLNHHMLLTLMEKVNGIHKHDELSWEGHSDDEDWSLWIDKDLPDEVDSLDDPDYAISGDGGEGQVAISDRTVYNLRRRLH
ncbi:hypothetical protein SAY87_003489 [Trapa incisa]|uniref:Protein GAMETE EXPRESSED 1 n=1 Tax=Trapa incisa TaxID=236973 RepID=A0AAN7QJ93_9MYRT|nr:hypothetical protein SAY87_003489 [Trapa incisa]